MLGGKVVTEHVDLRMCALGPRLREILSTYEEWQDGSALIVECALDVFDTAAFFDDVFSEEEARAFADEVFYAVERLEAAGRRGYDTDSHPLWDALDTARRWRKHL